MGSEMCIRDRLAPVGGVGDADGVAAEERGEQVVGVAVVADPAEDCLLYTSDAADERSSVDLGGRRIIKKKNRSSKRVQICLYITRQN